MPTAIHVRFNKEEKNIIKKTSFVMFVVCVLLGPALWCCGTGHRHMESKDSCEVQQNK